MQYGDPMATIKPKLESVDPVWLRVRQEAELAIENEPLLGGMIHATVLHHRSLEAALGYRIAQKLNSAEMSEQLLREITDEAYRSAPELGQAARAEIRRSGLAACPSGSRACD